MNKDITQKILCIIGNFELSEVEQINELEILYKKQEQEIERQKKVINGMIENEEKYLLEINKLKENNQAMQEEMARTWKKLDEKENIIKEVRVYIENNKIYTNEKQDAYTLKNTWYGIDLLGILDKENKND